MTTKPPPSTPTTRKAKKAIVMNTGKKNPAPIVIIASVVAIAAAAGLGLFLFPRSEPIKMASAPPAAPNGQDGRFTYAVSQFDDGQARHFDFADTGSNTTIKYFILKSADGVIRAAFDACDVCWPEGKGYVQDGTADADHPG